MSINDSLKKYAVSCISFVLNELPDKYFHKIKNILLFGSVSLGTATKESDIDLFFDVKGNRATISKIKKIIKEKIGKFYLSNIGLQFKLDGITNEIKPMVGDLEKWDLKQSIIENSTVLYGPYRTKIKGLIPHLIIYWDKIGENRGAFLNKLYGYKARNKKYAGLLEKINGSKIGKSSILIPTSQKSKVIKLLEEHKVGYEVLSVGV